VGLWRHLDRWPVAEQAAAQAWLAQSPGAHDVLAQASELDASLDAWRVPAPDGALMRRDRGHSADGQALWRRAVIWWSGLAVAATAAAGGVTGALVLADRKPGGFGVGDGL